MKEIREELEKVQFETWVVKDLLKILDEHFQAPRHKDNVALDHWSITHLFSQYTTLNYTIEKKLDTIEQSLTSIVNKMYENCQKEI